MILVDNHADPAGVAVGGQPGCRSNRIPIPGVGRPVAEDEVASAEEAAIHDRVDESWSPYPGIKGHDFRTGCGDSSPAPYCLSGK